LVVGSGLILDNTLYRGEGFVAGELGHMPLNETGPRCSCNGVACFERYVGNHALAAEAVKRFRRRIRLEDVTALARQGQAKAIRFWEDAGTRIGRGLIGTVNLLNPPLIIIGGGVSNAPSFVLKIIERTIKARAMKVQGAMVKVVHAALGTDAGIIGARVLVTGK
jgi:predicted NBD/HSP70 family sugar kinase